MAKLLVRSLDLVIHIKASESWKTQLCLYAVQIVFCNRRTAFVTRRGQMGTIFNFM